MGCGQGFESVKLAGPGRSVVGIDYHLPAVQAAVAQFGARGLHALVTGATDLGLGDGTFDWVCSSHLIEHFEKPGHHAAELARVLAPGGTAFVVTPNAPADFENPFHVSLFRQGQLAELLGQWFEDVSVVGIDAVPAVKEDFARRRAKAARLLRLDVLDLRHRLPRSWYVAAYERLLPVAYRLLATADSGGGTGITADDFSVTDTVDDSTLVLFAIARRPRHPAGAGGPGSA